jgi:hypothetical protein
MPFRRGAGARSLKPQTRGELEAATASYAGPAPKGRPARLSLCWPEGHRSNGWVGLMTVGPEEPLVKPSDSEETVSSDSAPKSFLASNAAPKGLVASHALRRACGTASSEEVAAVQLGSEELRCEA